MILHRKSLLFWILLAVAVHPIAVYVIWPVLQTLAQSILIEGGVGQSAYRTTVGAGASGWSALQTSVIVSVGTVAGAALVGVPVAFLLGRVDFPGRRLASVLVVFPLALPPLVGVLFFMFLFGSFGILPLALQRLLATEYPPLQLSGINAVLVVHIYSLFPFYTVFVSQALRGIDRSLTESSRALGAGHMRTFRRVTMPLLWPAFTSATLLVFMTSMASFSAPYLFAADRHFLSTDIYWAKINGHPAEMLALTVVLTAISLSFLVMIRTLGPARVLGAGKGTPPPLRPVRNPLARGLAAATAAFFCFLVLLPHLMIVFLAFVKVGSWTDTVLPTAYTFQNFVRMGTEGAFVRPITNSLQMALMAAVGVGVYGIVVALLIVRGRFRGRGLLEMSVMLPWALPGTVIAVSLTVALVHPEWWTLGISGVALLPLAYFIRFVPLGVRSSASALEQMDPALEEASASLGAGPVATFRRILLPLIWPGCVAGMLITFVTALGEFTSSILLFNARNKPISVMIDERIRIPDLGGASAYAVLLLILVLVALVVSRKALRVGDQVRL